MSAQPAAEPAAQSAGPAAPQRAALARARHWAGVVLDPSALAMRRIALAGVVASAAIIPTGAAVRLSQSGLGCTNWPKCTATSLVAAGASGDPLIHRWIEFGNRMITAVIFVIAIAVFVAAWRFRDGHARAGQDGGQARAGQTRAGQDGAGQRGSRRRDLVWLASAQPAGIAIQAGVGGIVVLTKLAPFWVSLHYLATIPVLAAAVALHVRCTESAARGRPLVPRLVRLVALALVAVVAVMFAAGTLVTGTGPLAGARSVPRYHFLSLTAVTQLHADIGWALGVLALALALMLQLVNAPARAVRLSWLVLGLIGLQGVIGYAQYFSGLPAGLVWVHVANTALIWIAVLRLTFALRDRGWPGEPAPGQPDATIAQTGSAQIGSAQTGSAQTGSAQAGSAQAGSAQAASTVTGQPIAKPLSGDAAVR